MYKIYIIRVSAGHMESTGRCHVSRKDWNISSLILASQILNFNFRQNGEYRKHDTFLQNFS